MKKHGEKEKEQTSSPIIPTKFERVARKVQEKKEKVELGLLKIKVTMQGIKDLTQEKKEVKIEGARRAPQPN